MAGGRFGMIGSSWSEGFVLWSCYFSSLDHWGNQYLFFFVILFVTFRQLSSGPMSLSPSCWLMVCPGGGASLAVTTITDSWDGLIWPSSLSTEGFCFIVAISASNDWILELNLVVVSKNFASSFVSSCWMLLEWGSMGGRNGWRAGGRGGCCSHWLDERRHN